MERNTSQFLIPLRKTNGHINSYDITPTHPLKNGTISIGYSSLARELARERVIVLDGYIGVDWQEVVEALSVSLNQLDLTLNCIDISDCFKSQDEIDAMIEPYLGGEDPIFGFRTELRLKEYFDPDRIAAITLDPHVDINIIYGTGASQSQEKGCLVYFDLPKNELQFRMRVETVRNLGIDTPKDSKQTYKHFYFIDWVVLNEEKKRLLPEMTYIVDQQRPKNPTWTTGDSLRGNLAILSRSCFRVRPWFEPGVWGGQWMKDRFKGINAETPNYAWSFEMIVPENGLLFEDQGVMLEVSFDMLMFQENQNVLGKAARRFGYDFPIRFDFLDTFDGGNLSVQCHPSPDYIKEHFGEDFTQDETYYILDARPDATVYLGFQDSIDPVEFKTALTKSHKENQLLEVERYVQKFPAKKHDLFLIPHGTVHCAGKNNMVLEISATPYIYTFKMYDWQRLDLDGSPRPLNIDHAFNNLDFNKKGEIVTKTLISIPETEESGPDWQKIHLPTHPDHFYSIYRYEFESEITIVTKDQCHVLMLVEGSEIAIDLAEDTKIFHYAETFAVPAATGTYKLINRGDTIAKVIVAFVKEEAC